MARRSPLRLVLWSAGWLLGVPLGVLILVLLALLATLAIPPARAAVTRYGLTYVERAFGYEVTIGRIDRLDPWAIELHDIEVTDPEQHDLGTVGELSLRIRPFALFDETLHVTEARLAHVRGRYDLEALLGQPSEPEAADESPSTFKVRVDLLRVLDTKLETPWSGRKLAATIDVLEGGGTWSAHPRVALTEAKLHVLADNEELLRLRAPKGTWSAERGGELSLAGTVAGAPLTLAAKLTPLDGAPWPVEQIELSLSDFGHEALRRLRLDTTFDLHTPLALHLQGESAGESVRIQAQLTAREATVHLEAKANLKSAEATLRVEPISLSAISPTLPALRVQGSLEAQADYAQPAIPIALAWRDIQVDVHSVPDGQAHAALALPWVRIESLSLFDLGSKLSFRGAYDTESGAADGKLKLARVQLEALAALRAQKIAGNLDGQLEFSLNAKGRVAGKVQLQGTGLAAAGSKVGSMSLGATLAGSKSSPQGSVQLQLTELASGDVHFASVRAELALSPDTLSGTLDGTGMNASLHSEIHGTRARHGELTVQARGQAQAAERSLTFQLDNLHYGRGILALERFALRSGEQSLLVQGEMRENGPLDADVAFHQIDLASWAALVGKPNLRGKLEGTVRLSGSAKKPAGTLRLSISKLSLMGEPEADATLQADADLQLGKFGATLELRSSIDGLNVRANLALDADNKRRDLEDALERGQFKLNGSAHLPASRLLMLGDETISALKGTVDADLQGQGTLADPHLALNVAARLRLPAKPSARAETLQANLNIEPTQAGLNVELEDDQGKLAHLDLKSAFAGGSLQAALAHPESFKNPSFETHLTLHERRLDTMQGVFGYLASAYKLNLPIRVGAKIVIESDGQSLDGDAALRFVVFGDKIDQSCVVGSSSALNVDAQLKQSEVQLSLTSQGDAAGQAQLLAKTHVDLAALMAGKTDQLERLNVSLQTTQVDLSKLPGLCALKSGKADVNLSAALFGNRPLELSSQVAIDDLQGQRGAAFGTHLSLHTVSAGPRIKVALKGDLRVDGKANGELEGSVPLAGNLNAMPSVAPDAAVQAHVRFRELPLSGPLSGVPELGQVGGTASADLSLAGTLEDPSLSGFVELHEVGFSIASLAQPVRHLNGRIEIRDRELDVKQLSAKDGDGELKLSGGLKLDEAGTGKGRVHVNADRFPLRQDGTVVGELTLDTEVSAQLEKLTELRVDVDINRGRMWLTGDQGRSVQQLDPNPDIVFEDTPPEAQADAATTEPSESSLVLKSLTIKSHRDMWIMHTDFSVQVALDLALTDEAEGAVMRGDAEITRGELQILGKTFKIQKGIIHFTGDVPPDPDLNLKATYQPPSSQPLTVQVSGLASAPVLTFSGAATNMGEAVSLLSGVGRAKASNNTAQQDVSNFASTLTAGLLSVAARRKFGDWVPTLGVETNASGQVNGARAGFDASDIIPKFMRGFARGAYVEGVVGGTSQTQGGSVGVGVRLDLSLPRDFVSSMGYGPGTRWSADLLWAP